MVLLEVDPDVHDEVAGVHVAQQTHEAAHVELDELLGQAHKVEAVGGQVVADEGIAGDADDVLLDDGLVIDEIVDAAGREDVFEFEPVDAVGVGAFDVEVVEVFVEGVDDAHAVGQRVAVEAQVHAVYVEVFDRREVAVGLQQGVGDQEILVNFVLFVGFVEDRRPVRILAFLVVERYGFVMTRQVGVADAQLFDPPIAHQIGLEEVADRIEIFLPADQMIRRARRLSVVLTRSLVGPGIGHTQALKKDTDAL